jgi:ribosome maturation factor RimP
LALQDIIEQTVTGLGYQTVEVERSAGGLLRITIDLPWTQGEPEQFVQVEDCEKVTRQLQFVLEVEGTEYSRLEVSSPGIDRPLRSENDFLRFVGEPIDITLKAPMGAAAGGLVAPNRKKFRGVLETTDTPQTWQITWRDEPASKPGMRPAKVKKDLPVQALQFTLSELRDARLAPIVNFKGRRPAENRSNES